MARLLMVNKTTYMLALSLSNFNNILFFKPGKILSVCLYDELSKTDIGEELVKAAVASPIKNLASTPSSSSSSLSSSSR